MVSPWIYRKSGRNYNMVSRIDFPLKSLPTKLVFANEDQMSDDQYFEFCMANPDVRFERTSRGEIVIVPPAGWESDDQNAEVITQLRSWAKRDGRGRASGSSTEVILPTGAALSPDAAWTSKERLSELSKT